jgi:orotidine-5'-phosphate decarboxylase
MKGKREGLYGKDRICLPLDGIDTVEQIAETVRILYPYVGMFKIGLELITKLGGPVAIKAVRGCGGKVFLDGKFNDIPNTVGAAAKAASAFSIDFFNLHASCGKKAMEAAVANKGASKVLAVTVLTSLGDAECISIFGESSPAKVGSLALLANEAGMDGVICSPKEVALLRSRPELNDLILVTPGVRPEWADTGDQKRVMTPYEAIKAGSDILVIGRPITKPPEKIGGPVEAALAVAEEILKAENELGL